MADTADVVVVGLGAMGSACLHRLAKRGARAVGIDRFHPPHDRGSTHGETRITRLAVAEGESYVPLVRRAHELWRELEAESGEALFRQNGLIVIGEGDGARSHGQEGFLGRTIAVAHAHGIPHEILDSAEIRRRYPQFRVRDAERAFFEPSAGVLDPEACVRVQLDLARRLGAVVRTGERVLAVEPAGSGVRVVTDQGEVQAGRAVLTAGAWLPELAGGALARHAEVHRQVLLWFEAADPALYAPERCPPFIWFHGKAEADYVYGFPIMPGGRGVKAATETYHGHVPPDDIDRAVSDGEARGIYERHVHGRFSGISDRIAHRATCLYTVTPDAGFVVDRLWESGAVVAASACSGHGFKHSVALGEELAALSLEPGRTPVPAWAAGRFTAA